MHICFTNNIYIFHILQPKFVILYTFGNLTWFFELLFQEKSHTHLKHSNTPFVTQYGPIGMSSPVSTGILKFRGGRAPSAQRGLPALRAPPAWSRSGRAAPRFPTLCKRCASFRTTKQPTAIRAQQGSRHT